MGTFFKLTSVTLFTTLILGSCSPKKDFNSSLYYPNALVTVKTAADGTCYLQLDDATTLRPENISKHPFKGKQVRALANITETKGDKKTYTKAVRVNWMDSIRTKKTVLTAGLENDKKYGTAPVEIVNNWMTVLEDRYLTISFFGIWGRTGKPHYINLLTGVNKNDPFEVELRHNANGDAYSAYAQRSMGIVAFDLSSLPKDVKGKKLKVKYLSFTGEKTITFEFDKKRENKGNGK